MDQACYYLGSSRLALLQATPQATHHVSAIQQDPLCGKHCSNSIRGIDSSGASLGIEDPGEAIQNSFSHVRERAVGSPIRHHDRLAGFDEGEMGE